MAGGRAVILGIDPGRNGAISAVFRDAETRMWRANPCRLPRSAHEIMDAATSFGKPVFAVIEKPFYPPHIGVRNISAMAEAFGALRAALQIANIPIHLVTPSEWKRALSVPTDSAGIRARATELFPEDGDKWRKSGDHDLAEASMIGWYGRRFE